MSSTRSTSALLLSDFRHELATTRRLLERLPDEHLGWKPHAKSMSLGALATHVVNLVLWQVMTLERDVFDLAGVPPTEPFSSRAALLGAFDERVARLYEVLAEADEEALAQPWTLRKGEAVLFEMPRATVLRGVGGLRHIVHHRGQLSVYLRLLDVPVPPLYGPTADEPASF